jgi:hypothetical protein
VGVYMEPRGAVNQKVWKPLGYSDRRTDGCMPNSEIFVYRVACWMSSRVARMSDNRTRRRWTELPYSSSFVAPC